MTVALTVACRERIGLPERVLVAIAPFARCLVREFKARVTPNITSKTHVKKYHNHRSK